MICIDRILKATGMNQEMLADYLGIRRQSLMDAASGRKTLSSKLFLKLVRLETCILSAETDVPPDLPGYPVPGEPASAKRSCGHNVESLNDCRYKAEFFQKKLDGLQKAKRQNIHLLKALNRMEPADEMEEKWIAIRKDDTIKKLNDFPEADFRLLLKRIHLLHAEADYLDRYLNEKDLPDQGLKTNSITIKNQKHGVQSALIDIHKGILY